MWSSWESKELEERKVHLLDYVVSHKAKLVKLLNTTADYIEKGLNMREIKRSFTDIKDEARDIVSTEEDIKEIIETLEMRKTMNYI